MVAQQLMQSDLLQCLTQATITILFFGVWKTSKEFPLETDESNCITILSSKVNSFCSTLLPMVEWSDDLAWLDELFGWLKQTSFRTWPAELKVPRPGYFPHPLNPSPTNPQTHKQPPKEHEHVEGKYHRQEHNGGQLLNTSLQIVRRKWLHLF